MNSSSVTHSDSLVKQGRRTIDSHQHAFDFATNNDMWKYDLSTCKQYELGQIRLITRRHNLFCHELISASMLILLKEHICADVIKFQLISFLCDEHTVDDDKEKLALMLATAVARIRQ